MSFAERRRRIAETVNDGVLVLVASPEVTRSHDTHYTYRPGSDLLWLTGYDEPGCVAVFSPQHPETPFVLFVRPRNKDSEIWDGHRYGPEGAVSRFGADAAYPLDELEARLPGLLATRSQVYYSLGLDTAFDARLLRMIEGLRPSRRQPGRAPAAIVDPRPLLHQLRMVKDEAELATMRRAASISAAAHLAAMRATRPGMYEYEMQALIEYEFMRAGARAPAYGSIVAGGANACVLHYTTNRDPLRDGELLLVDAGAEFDWYAGDITRTWPIGREFTGPQRDLYAAVLDVNERIVARVVPGESKDSLQQASIRMLTEHLVQLGLLSGSVDENIEKEHFRRFYMHGVGHYLGMDVHDVGEYMLADGSQVLLRPGMVMTVEPGLYVQPDDESVPAAFRGIGVRIEDDVVVTSHAPENLTTGVPKSIAAVEALRRESLG
jgi:Xaa-Pro aminopeptidase